MRDLRHACETSALCLAGLGLVLGCGSIPTPHAAAGPPISMTELVGSTWRAVEIEGQSVEGRHPPEIVVDSRTHVSGTGGCNTFQAPVAAESAGVRFGPIASTRKACEPPLMDQEQRFFAALQKQARLQGNLDLLFLIGDDGQQTLRFMRVFAADDDTGP